MRRYFRSFLMFNQEDPGFSVNGQSAGYIKTEVKDGKGKLFVHLQNMKDSSDRVHYKVYLLKCSENDVFSVEVGKVNINRNRGELQIDFDPDNVFGSGLAIEEFNGAVIKADSNVGKAAFPLVTFRDRKYEWRSYLVSGVRKGVKPDYVLDDSISTDEDMGDILKKKDVFSKYTGGGLESKYTKKDSVQPRNIEDREVGGLISAESDLDKSADIGLQMKDTVDIKNIQRRDDGGPTRPEAVQGADGTEKGKPENVQSGPEARREKPETGQKRPEERHKSAEIKTERPQLEDKADQIEKTVTAEDNTAEQGKSDSRFKFRPAPFFPQDFQSGAGYSNMLSEQKMETDASDSTVPGVHIQQQNVYRARGQNVSKQQGGIHHNVSQQSDVQKVNMQQNYKCPYLQNNICTVQSSGYAGSSKSCVGCGAMKPVQGPGREGKSVDLDLLSREFDKYFEKANPFGNRKGNYRWWKVNSPVYLNNILYQQNIKTPLLFNPSVMMAHFKYRHLIIGIYSDKTRRKEYVVGGVPGVYNIDERPFGEMCRWVQLEGYKPKYGAFGYWLVYIDPKSGSLLRVN